MLMSGWTVCAAAAGVSLVAWVPVMGLLILLISLQRVFRSAPLLSSDPPAQPSDQALTVVIPAYNEQDNIVRCLSSVLASDPPALNWSVVVVDDQSTDRTAELAREIVAARDNRAITCRIMESGERPMDERWVGKNWACSQAMDVVETPWVLFLDADVVLSRDALKRALASVLLEAKHRLQVSVQSGPRNQI